MKSEKKAVQFPILLDDSVMDCPVGWAAHILQTRHIGDFNSSLGPVRLGFNSAARGMMEPVSYPLMGVQPWFFQVQTCLGGLIR